MKALLSTLIFLLSSTALAGVPVIFGAGGATLLTASICFMDNTCMSTATSGGGVWGAITGTLANQTDLQAALNAKQNSLGFTAENVANKDIDATMAANSDTKYPSQKAVKTALATKEPTLAAGTSAQYYRGDKSWQTLNTLAVPELTNLYYTDARVQAAAKAGTSNLKFYVTKDAGSDLNDCSRLLPCKTIQVGINAANAVAAYLKQAIVVVQPSNGTTSYQENLTLSQQGVVLQCDNSVQNTRACVVNGTVTVNLTGTSGGGNFIAASNETYINGFVFTSGVSTTLTFSGTTYQKVILTNSYMQAGAGSAASVTNTGVSGSTPSQISSFDTTWENNSATLPVVTLTAGRFWLYGTTQKIHKNNAAGPSITQNGPSSMIANFTQFTGQYNLTDNTATATFNLSTIASGSNPCIVTPSSPSTGYALLAYFGCNSSATNSITGTGVVVNAPGNVRFGTSGDIVSTVTQASIGPGLPQGEIIVGPGAVTGTNVLVSIKGGHVKATQTTAPTASPSANAGTSATCTLSNASDVAGTINLTEGSGSWASGTQCTVTFNKAYGAAPICSFSPTNAAAAAHAVTQQVNLTTTTTTMLVAFGAADSAATAYKIMYHCIETQ